MTETEHPGVVSGVPLANPATGQGARGSEALSSEAPILSRDRKGAFGTRPSSFKLRDLLLPHWKALLGGMVAVIGASIANLLDPWPLKVVIDNVIKPRHTHGWLNHFVLFVAGTRESSLVSNAPPAAPLAAGFF